MILGFGLGALSRALTPRSGTGLYNLFHNGTLEMQKLVGNNGSGHQCKPNISGNTLSWCQLPSVRKTTSNKQLPSLFQLLRMPGCALRIMLGDTLYWLAWYQFQLVPRCDFGPNCIKYPETHSSFTAAASQSFVS